MKKLSFFVSAFALCASTSYAAINCGTLPTCASLGYTDTVANCPSSSEVLKCPFDTTMGKCTRGPSVGDLKYSLRGDDHDGWLLCNGRQFESDSTAKYFKLFQVIGTNFCHKFTSKTDASYTTSNCTSGKFALPDYRGFFLRAATSKNPVTSISGSSTYYSTAFDKMGGDGNSNLYLPQYERLPNITGTWAAHGLARDKINSGDSTVSGALYLANVNKSSWAGNSNLSGYTLMYGIGLDASKPKGSVYQNNGHVIPANYAANIFIYAGR